MKDNSCNNHNTSELQCQPVGSKAISLIPNLIKSLSQTTKELFEELTDLAEWEGADLLRKLIKENRSCLVVGEDRSGKSCASSIAEDDTEELKVISYPNDTYDIYKQLWHLVDYVIPKTTQQIKDPQQTNPPHSKERILRCGHCSRHCIVDPTAKLKGPIVPSPTISGIIKMFQGITGKCPLIIKQVNDHLSQLQGSIFVIRVPDVDTDLLTLFTQLLEIGTLVILANPRQAKQLREEHNRFRSLPIYRFPKPKADFFIEVVKIRVEDIGMDTSPFTPKACLSTALLSGKSIGKYVENLARGLDQLQLDGRLEQIDPKYMLKVAADSLDEDSMILNTISNYEGWFGISKVSKDIKDAFDTDISPKRIGWRLKELVDGNKLEKRHIGKTGIQYKIRDQDVPLLEAGLTDIKALPEGDDNGKE